MKIRLTAAGCLIAAFALLAPAASSGLMAQRTSPASTKYDERLASVLKDWPTEVPVIVTTEGRPGTAAAHATAVGARVTWIYDIIDGFAAKLRPAVLNTIANRADVTRIHLDRDVGPVMDVSHAAIEADKVWDKGNRGAGQTVAVIDTGIDPLHPSFAGAVAGCVSTIAGLVSPECIDTDGHGTHVAGTVASRHDTYRGIAPEAKLAIVRVLHAAGAGVSSDIIAGMDWVLLNKDKVTPPIRVATMSIGDLNPGCGDDSNPEAKAANQLVASGVFFSVAAGNSGHKRCTIDGAAAASEVTTIAAVDDRESVGQGDDVIASFSSGGSSKNNKPDVSFPGVNITSAFLGAGALVATMDGTSMATPHAAGTAALVLSAEPGLSAQQVKDRITGTAVKTPNTGNSFNHVYGHGLGNACRAACSKTASTPSPTKVHVESIETSSKHVQRTGHEVTGKVTVKDAAGNAVGGASVSAEFASPEGNKYSSSGATDTSGMVTLSAKQRNGGHGTWTVCVTSVSGSNIQYDPNANVETCETRRVT